MSRLTITAAPIILALALSGCGRGGENEQALNAIDQSLAGDAADGQADPALTAALEDQIMVDPSLSAQSNRDAARPARQPVRGSVPETGTGAVPSAAELGRLMKAPAPSPAAANDAASPATLGALAQAQAAKRGQACDARLDYGFDWANRLPADLPLYPRAQVYEAAGRAGGPCDIRVVSFTTGATLQAVLDYYYTRGVEAGFKSSHEVDGGEHLLGGVRDRDGGAFVVMARARQGGGTEVDLLANNGR